MLKNIDFHDYGVLKTLTSRYNIAMSNRPTSRLFFVGILLLFSFGFYANASAEDSISSEVLSNIWYSTPKINTGDTITVKTADHVIEVKILNIKEIEVKKPIPEVVKTPMEKVTDTANTVVGTANQLTNKLADYVESFKTPAENATSLTKTNLLTDTVSLDKNQEKVLGVSTENIPAPATKNILQKLPFYNPLLDLVAFLIHQWVWVLAAILLFILYLIFT